MAIVFPALILWLIILYRLDRNWRDKRSGHVIALMVLAGGLCVIPTGFAYDINPFWFTYWYGASRLSEAQLVTLEKELTGLIQDEPLAERVYRVLNPPLRTINQWVTKRAWLGYPPAGNAKPVVRE